MHSRTYTSEGIVLARKNFGEADRILWVYSKKHGRISLIAKGVRKPTSRKRGHIEIFSHINFQAAKGRNMDILTEVEIIDNYPEIRKSLKKVSLAYYFCEVIGKITHEGEGNIKLFELIDEELTKLKFVKELKKLRLEFIEQTLILLGFWPAGKKLLAPDQVLTDVIERDIVSARVGKRMVQ